MTDAMWAVCWLAPWIIVLLAQLARAERTLQRERDLIFGEHIRWRNERESWAQERQQLLDRIQAPSFAEYKSAEIKLEKVKNGEKEPPRLEPL